MAEGLKLTQAQLSLLKMLAPKSGVIFVRGDDAETAISLAATPLVALGPTEGSGAVMVQITAEGRTALTEAGRLAIKDA